MPPTDLFGAARARPRTPRIFTVPHGTPFLWAVAEALLAGNLPLPGGRPPQPLELAGITLLLPTRRDIDALHAAFLKAGRTTGTGAALLLPKIKLISHSGEPAVAFGSDGAAVAGAGKPAIGKLERELTLMRLVLK